MRCGSGRFIVFVPFWSDFIKEKKKELEKRKQPFNPTMVWFYQDEKLRDNFIEFCFQSHYGLILSLSQNTHNYHNCSFQSHYGLILSRAVAFYKKNYNTLSIPLWSDFIARLKGASRWITKLSIPLWSDFIKISEKDVKIGFGFFQSHYGLILSSYLSVITQLYSCRAFNPTMVWFYHRIT